MQSVADVSATISDERHRRVQPLLDADVDTENELGAATVLLQAVMSELRRCADLLCRFPASDSVLLRACRAADALRAAETRHAIADGACLAARRELLFGVAELLGMCATCGAALPAGDTGECMDCSLSRDRF